MPDMPRREVLLARSNSLRERATAFGDRMKDQRAKDWLRTIVFHHLDDVDGFFLGDPQNRLSMETWETMWVNNAEMILSMAEKAFADFEKQANQYGGPENIVLVG